MNINVLINKTLTEVKRHRGEDDEIQFVTDEGLNYTMAHQQDCCEHVWIEDICGNLDDLVGSPILIAEEAVNSPHEGTTWTFYRLATIKGYVMIRWNGESNGYYSETVDFWENK